MQSSSLCSSAIIAMANAASHSDRKGEEWPVVQLVWFSLLCHFGLMEGRKFEVTCEICVLKGELVVLAANDRRPSNTTSGHGFSPVIHKCNVW